LENPDKPRLCDQCFAQKPSKKGDPKMNFKDMRAGASYQLTVLDHSTYMATHPPSPWHVVPGWSLTNTVFDFMHNCFPGTSRIFIASAIRLLLHHGVFDSYGVDRDSSAMFAYITMDIHKDFKDLKFLDVDLVLLVTVGVFPY